MEIKTKFNHGDRVQAIILGQEEYKENCPICEGSGKVQVKGLEITCPNSGCWGNGYILKQRDSKWFVPTDPYFNFVVQKIGIELYNLNNKRWKDNRSWIYYMSASSGTMFDENNLFLTEKEAQEECDKRNGK